MPVIYVSPPSEQDLEEWANRMLTDKSELVNLTDRGAWIDFVTSQFNFTDRQVMYLDKARGMLNDTLKDYGYSIGVHENGTPFYRDLTTGRFTSGETVLAVMKGIFT